MHVISRFWTEIGAWLFMFELSIPFVLWPVLNLPVKLFVCLLISIFMISTFIAYLFIPFKDYGQQKK
jgi:hypothetical protein